MPVMSKRSDALDLVKKNPMLVTQALNDMSMPVTRAPASAPKPGLASLDDTQGRLRGAKVISLAGDPKRMIAAHISPQEYALLAKRNGKAPEKINDEHARQLGIKNDPDHEDKVLARISIGDARVLKAAGGSGLIDPDTHDAHFDDGGFSGFGFGSDDGPGSDNGGADGNGNGYGFGASGISATGTQYSPAQLAALNASAAQYAAGEDADAAGNTANSQAAANVAAAQGHYATVSANPQSFSSEIANAETALQAAIANQISVAQQVAATAQQAATTTPDAPAPAEEPAPAPVAIAEPTTPTPAPETPPADPVAPAPETPPDPATPEYGTGAQLATLFSNIDKTISAAEAPGLVQTVVNWLSAHPGVAATAELVASLTGHPGLALGLKGVQGLANSFSQATPSSTTSTTSSPAASTAAGGGSTTGTGNSSNSGSNSDSGASGSGTSGGGGGTAMGSAAGATTDTNGQYTTGMGLNEAAGGTAVPSTNTDTTATTTAAPASDAYDWFKNLYTSLAPERQNVATAAGTAQTAANTSSALDQTSAGTDRATYDANFTPTLNKIVSDANTFDSEGEANRLAQEGEATVGQQYGVQQQALGRQLQSYGINPTSAKYQAQMAGLSGAEASAAASAANAGRIQGRELGTQKLVQAAQLSSPLAGQSTTEGNAGVVASQAGLSAAQVPNATDTTAGALIATGAGLNNSATSIANNYDIGLKSAANSANATGAQIAASQAAQNVAQDNATNAAIGAIASNSGTIANAGKSIWDWFSTSTPSAADQAAMSAMDGF